MAEASKGARTRETTTGEESHPGGGQICTVGFCPICMAVTAVQPLKPEAIEHLIAPESLLPFSVSDREARDRFNKWLHSLWFAPTELRQLANLGQFGSVYAPYWTYDASFRPASGSSMSAARIIGTPNGTPTRPANASRAAFARHVGIPHPAKCSTSSTMF